jgi:Matrixin/Fibronectin type III domain
MKLATRSLVLVLAAAFAVLVPPVGATSYQMISDDALTDQASAIVQARVVGVEPAPVAGRPSTDYLVEIERVLKGDLPGSTVVVRIPGGVGPDGIGLKVWGAPEFRESDRTLLFLSPQEDGTYRVLHLMLGAFRQQVTSGSRVALRDLSETIEVGPQGIREGGADQIRDFERFSDWIADRAAGIERRRDYLLGSSGGGLQSAIEKYTLLDSSRGNNIRWFQFDRGQSVEWQVHESGQPGLGLDRTIAAFQVALDTWVSDPATNILYSYVGTTNTSQGFTGSDRRNVVLFDDPHRDSSDGGVEGTFTCAEGGVIAVGGPYFYSSTRSHRGKAYHEAAEADIVTNDGTDCFFQNNPRVAEEVFAHELGHTLGLGHSQQRDALMWSKAHNDGRGARLSADDLAAANALYGSGSGSGSGPATLRAPQRLTGKISGAEVALTWRDRSVGEESYRVEIKPKGRKKFQETLTLPADSTSTTVTGLNPGIYILRVRAANGNKFSPYSNAVTVTVPRG